MPARCRAPHIMISSMLVALPILILLGVSPLAAKLTWDVAPQEVLERFYRPYELCLLGASSQSRLASTTTLFNQSACLHLIASMEGVDKRCWIGAKHQFQDSGLCVAPSLIMIHTHGKRECTPLHEKKGFFKHWAHLKTGNYHTFHDFLFKAMRGKGYHTLGIGGDSMAVQLGQRLGCAIARNGSIEHEFVNSFFHLRQSGASVVVSPPGGQGAKATVSIYKVTNAIGSIHTSTEREYSHCITRINTTQLTQESHTNENCRTEHFENTIYKKTLASMRTSQKWANTLHLVVLPVIHKQHWEMKPYVSALLHAAELMRTINSKIVVLSPFRQHFHPSSSGLYEKEVFKTGFLDVEKKQRLVFPERQLCVDIVNKTAEHPDLALFRRTAGELDSEWNAKLGLFDIGAYSLPWHDLHSETRTTGFFVDCTHFVFQPMMFEAVWSDLCDLVDAL